MATTKAIVLRYNKSIHEVLIPSVLCTGQLDVNLVNGIKNKGHGNIERECDFEWDDHLVSVYGWTDGSESKINKHDLPPPIDNILYYGDVLVVKHENGKLKDFSKTDYNKFYDDAFGGFDDIVSEDESSEDEPTQSDIDFIASDSELSEGNISSEEEEALTSSQSESEEDSEELNLNDKSSESIESGYSSDKPSSQQNNVSEDNSNEIVLNINNK
jgi:hypothetical protein